MFDSGKRKRRARYKRKYGADADYEIWVQHRSFLRWRDHRNVENNYRQALWDVLVAWKDLIDALERVKKFKGAKKEIDKIITQDVNARGKKFFNDSSASNTFPETLKAKDVKAEGSLVNKEKDFEDLDKKHKLMSLLDKGALNASAPKGGPRAVIVPQGSPIPPGIEHNFDEAYSWKLDGKGNPNQNQNQQRSKKGGNNQQN